MPSEPDAELPGQITAELRLPSARDATTWRSGMPPGSGSVSATPTGASFVARGLPSTTSIVLPLSDARKTRMPFS